MAYSSSRDGDRIKVAMDGRLTFQEQASVKQLISELQSDRAGAWYVDLTGIEFMDSAGLGLLLRLKKVADDCGAALTLRVPPSGQLRRLLDVARFSDLMTIES